MAGNREVFLWANLLVGVPLAGRICVFHRQSRSSMLGGLEGLENRFGAGLEWLEKHLKYLT